MSVKRKEPGYAELYVELQDLQMGVLDELLSEEIIDWDELRRLIHEAGRGFLGDRALFMLAVIELSIHYAPERPLFLSKRRRLALALELIPDFQIPRQLLFRRGLVRPIEKPPGRLAAPKEFSVLPEDRLLRAQEAKAYKEREETKEVEEHGSEEG